MAKLRKMLGKVDEPAVQSLMEIIETQSKETLAAWAVGYVKTHTLAIYEKEFPQDNRLRKAVEAVESCLRGEQKFKDVKPVIKEAADAAKEAGDHPVAQAVAQAAARSVSVACNVLGTPTNALGFTFYTAAAIVYDREGTEEKSDIYDTMATKELEKMLISLKEAAVPDESKPVKVNWRC